MEGKIFDNLSQTGAVGCAAVPLFLDHGWRTARQAGRPRAADRRRGDEVDLRGIVVRLDGSRAVAGTS